MKNAWRQRKLGARPTFSVCLDFLWTFQVSRVVLASACYFVSCIPTLILHRLFPEDTELLLAECMLKLSCAEGKFKFSVWRLELTSGYVQENLRGNFSGIRKELWLFLKKIAREFAISPFLLTLHKRKSGDGTLLTFRQCQEQGPRYWGTFFFFDSCSSTIIEVGDVE